MPVRDLDPYLTLRDAAAVLRLHPRTVRRFLKRGDLQGRLVCHRWRVRRSDLDTFVDAQPGAIEAIA